MMNAVATAAKKMTEQQMIRKWYECGHLAAAVPSPWDQALDAEADAWYDAARLMRERHQASKAGRPARRAAAKAARRAAR